jgi:hypothetical protein
MRLQFWGTIRAVLMHAYTSSHGLSHEEIEYVLYLDNQLV